MKDIIDKFCKPKSIHDYAKITVRTKELSNELIESQQLILKNNYTGYNDYIKSLTIDQRVSLMENIYSSGKLIRTYNFPKLYVEPFISDLKISMIKPLNLRLLCLYNKWYNHSRKMYIKSSLTEWDNTFQRLKKYYKSKWMKDTSNFLMSLIFSPTAYEYSKNIAELIETAGEYVTKNGIPEDIKLHSDAHRMLMCKVQYIKGEDGIDALNSKLIRQYFVNKNNNYVSNIVPLTFEYVKLYEEEKNQYIKDIESDIEAEIEKALSKADQKQIDIILSLLFNRLHKIKAINKGIELIHSKINFENISINILCYLNDLLIKARKFINNPKYVKALYNAIDNYPENIWINTQIVDLNKRFSFLTNEKLEKAIEASNRTDISDMNYIIHQILFAKSYGVKYHPIITSFIDNYFKVPENKLNFRYNSVITKLVKWYSYDNFYASQEPWNEFLALLSNNDKLKSLPRSTARDLFIIYILLKDSNIIDISTLIDKRIWNEMLNKSEQLFNNKSTSKLCNYIIKIYKEMNVDDIYSYSLNYWMLPIVIPSRKIAYIFNNNYSNDFYKYIEVKLKKKNWTIYNDTSHATLINKLKAAKINDYNSNIAPSHNKTFVKAIIES